MDQAEFPPRWRAALAQLRRETLAPSWPVASWTSVLRRCVVFVACFAIGLYTHELNLAIYAAFGALQMGLMEAALPFLGLVRLLAVNTVAITVVAYFAAALSGTWWTVPLLGAVAFVQGATVSAGLVQMVSTIGALVMGVIFAGLPHISSMAGTAAFWLLIGASAQSLVWLTTWHVERRLFIRRTLANCIRGVRSLARHRAPSGRDSDVQVLRQDAARQSIGDSGIAGGQEAAARVLLGDIDELRRSIVTWRVLRVPGLSEQWAVEEHLRRVVRRVDESPTSRMPDRLPSLGEPAPWACDRAVTESLAILDDSVLALQDPAGPLPAAPQAGAEHPEGSVTRDVHATLTALRPSSPMFRHGLRMSLAIMVAQVVTLFVEIGHSFWIPLTVVFVLKPDWSFTLVRSSERFLGNLAAIIFVPILLLAAIGAAWSVAAMAFVLSAIAFRYFTGNYIAASFGIAGTILLLDETLSPDPALYPWRVIATVLGTVIALVVSLVVPTMRARTFVDDMDELLGMVLKWARAVCRGLLDPATVDPAHLRTLGARARGLFASVRPGADAALLEPHPRGDARAIVLTMNAAERAQLCLIALSFHAQELHRTGQPGVPIEPVVARIGGAGTRGGNLRRPAGDADHWEPRPRSSEDAAVVTQTLLLEQSMVDMAAAAELVRASVAS